jgi:hypothetical protein
MGGDPLTDDDTDPVGGEQVGDEPGVGAGAGAGISFPFLPIIFPKKGYKQSDLVVAESGLTLQMTGSLSQYRFGFRARQHRSQQAQTAAAAAVLGVVPSTIETKTASKLPLSAYKAINARSLPFRAR